jgi:hypothetical protein
MAPGVHGRPSSSRQAWSSRAARRQHLEDVEEREAQHSPRDAGVRGSVRDGKRSATWSHPMHAVQDSILACATIIMPSLIMICLVHFSIIMIE